MDALDEPKRNLMLEYSFNFKNVPIIKKVIKFSNSISLFE